MKQLRLPLDGLPRSASASKAPQKKPKWAHRIQCEACNKLIDPHEVAMVPPICCFCIKEERLQFWYTWWFYEFFYGVDREQRPPENPLTFGELVAHYQQARRQARLLYTAIRGADYDVRKVAFRALAELRVMGEDRPLLQGWKEYVIARTTEALELDALRAQLKLGDLK